MLRLNTMLTKRGFVNTTENFGMGKTNAAWKKDTIKVTRRKVNNKIIVCFEDLFQEESFVLPDQENELKEFIIKRL